MASTERPARRIDGSAATQRTRSTSDRGTGAAGGVHEKMPPRSMWPWFFVVLFANYLLVKLLIPGPEAPLTVPYTVFKTEVANGNVEAIYSRGEVITGRFVKPVTYPPAGEQASQPDADSPLGSSRRSAPRTSTTFTTTLPTFVDPGLERFLIDSKVEISAEPIQEEAGPLATLLFSFGPGLLFIGFYVWMFRRAAQQGGLGGGLMGIGRSKARRYDQERDAKVTFADVA